MSENYEYCIICEKAHRIGLEDEADENYTCDKCLKDNSGQTGSCDDIDKEITEHYKYCFRNECCFDEGIKKGYNKGKSEGFNEDIAFYAFRYALGRMTYAVKDVVDYLIENWNNVSIKNKELIIKEIDIAIKEGKAGMDCDVKQWQKLKELKQSLLKKNKR